MKRETYRGWLVYYEPPPIPDRSCDWHYVHPDYDGPGDNRYGHAATLEACRAAIDEYEASK